jgi:type IX secretion system PorP/SprF family membrane protein
MYVRISSPHFYYRPFGGLSGMRSSTTYRPHYILQAGYINDLTESLKLKAHIITNYVNGSPCQIDLNGSILISETLWLGASYRSFDSFNVIAQMYLGESIAIGYSYDFTSTALAKVERGSHEISLN